MQEVRQSESAKKGQLKNASQKVQFFFANQEDIDCFISTFSRLLDVIKERNFLDFVKVKQMTHASKL